MATKKAAEKAVEQAVENENFRNLSRWFQLVGVPVTLGLLFWMASATYDISVRLARVETKVDNLDGERYSRSDAMKDFENISNRITAVENAEKIRVENFQEQLRSITAQFLQLKTKVDGLK